MTRNRGDIINAMLASFSFFEARCEDKDTLRKLIALANKDSWREDARTLFREIRAKTLVAERRGIGWR